MRITILLFALLFTGTHVFSQQESNCPDARSLLQLQFSKKKNYYNYIHETSFALPSNSFYTLDNLQWLFQSSREFISEVKDKRPPQECCPVNEFLPDIPAISSDKKLLRQLLRNFATDDIRQLFNINAGNIYTAIDDERFIIYRNKEHVLGEAVIRREILLRDSFLVIRTTEEGSANGEEIRKMFLNRKLMDEWWKQTDNKFINFVLAYPRTFDQTFAHRNNILFQSSPAARCRIEKIIGQQYHGDFTYDPSGRISAISIIDGKDSLLYRYVYAESQPKPVARISGLDTLTYAYDIDGRISALEYHHAARPGHRLDPTRIFIQYPAPGIVAWVYPSDFGESLKYEYRADSSGLETVYSTFVNYESRAIEKSRSRTNLLQHCGQEVLNPLNALYENVLGPIFEFPLFYFPETRSPLTSGTVAEKIRVISVNEFGYPTSIQLPGKEPWQLTYECR